MTENARNQTKLDKIIFLSVKNFRSLQNFSGVAVRWNGNITEAKPGKFLYVVSELHKTLLTSLKTNFSSQ